MASDLKTAVSTALEPVAHLEKEYEIDQLSQKICQYFQRALKKVTFGSRPWDQLVNEFADSVFGSLFTGLSGREWLGELDLLSAFDAAIRERFPKFIFAASRKAQYEKVVQEAYERAFDDQRFFPILWDFTAVTLEDKKDQKKLYDAVDAARGAARKATKQAGFQDPQATLAEYMRVWARQTVAGLRAKTNSREELDKLMNEDSAKHFFTTLVEGGGLPAPMVNQFGKPPSEWPVIEESIKEAYAAAEATEVVPAGADPEQPAPDLPKARGRAEGYGQAADPEEEAAWNAAMARRSGPAQSSSKGSSDFRKNYGKGGNGNSGKGGYSKGGWGDGGWGKGGYSKGGGWGPMWGVPTFKGWGPYW